MGFVDRQTLLGKRLMVKKGNVGGQAREFLGVRLLDPKEARKKDRAMVDVEMFQVPSFYDPIEALRKFRERSRFALDPDLPVFRSEIIARF